MTASRMPTSNSDPIRTDGPKTIDVNGRPITIADKPEPYPPYKTVMDERAKLEAAARKTAPSVS